MNSIYHIQNEFIDQIVIALPSSHYNTYSLMLNYFENKYGRKTFVPKNNHIYEYSGYYFKKAGFFISYRCFEGWCYLIFNGDKSIYNKLYRDIEYFKKKRWIQNRGKYKFHLHKIERSNDFISSYTNHEENIKVLEFLSRYIIPKKNSGLFNKIYIGDGVQICSDGAINGSYTVYWHSSERNSMPTGKPVKTKNASFEYKIYCKKYENLWHVRFEIAFLRPWLRRKKIDLPNTYDKLEKIISKIRFDDYWIYIDIDKNAFIKNYTHLLKLRGLPPISFTQRRPIVYNRYPGSLFQMRWLAKKINADNLSCTLNKFIHVYSSDEMYKFIFSVLRK